MKDVSRWQPVFRSVESVARGRGLRVGLRNQRRCLVFFALFALIVPGVISASALAAAAFNNIPDTGQTTCFNSGGSVVSCAGTGQDGAYLINNMSISSNVNGHVTDGNTGLMWQQSSSGFGYTYDSSVSYCDQLVLDNYTDWRLPSKKELIGILDYNTPGFHPAFSNTSDYYWTSTITAFDSNSAWQVFVPWATVGPAYKSTSMSGRCVRDDLASPQPKEPTPQDFGDTVTDTRTGLVWQKGEPGAKSWDAALTYCEGLTLAGVDAWRLPNVKELESIVDGTRQNPAISTLFTNANSAHYWSSTTAWVRDYATRVDFATGWVDNASKSDSKYVRCVCDGLAPLPAWRTGEATVTWQHTDWFGNYRPLPNDWFFHEQHGNLYPVDDGNGWIYIWYSDMNKWVYTSPTVYPWMYRYDGGNSTWILYKKGSANPRLFYNDLTHLEESLP